MTYDDWIASNNLNKNHIAFGVIEYVKHCLENNKAYKVMNKPYMCMDDLPKHNKTLLANVSDSRVIFLKEEIYNIDVGPIMDWVIDNIKGSWYSPRFNWWVFSNYDDAVLFKLTWA